MVKNAWNFILPSWALALAMAWLGGQGHPLASALAALLLVFSFFCAWFFRSPQRQIPGDPSLLVSPADGKVLELIEVNDPYVGKGWELKIFLNVFNVHVQRSPFTVASLVEGTRYYAGKFLAANAPKASLDNEQHWMRLQARPGGRQAKVVVKQIAGLIARRIIPWVRPGDQVAAGALLGLIQFGSQVDLIFAGEYKPCVHVGDTVIGGETVVAQRQGVAAKRRGR